MSWKLLGLYHTSPHRFIVSEISSAFNLCNSLLFKGAQYGIGVIICAMEGSEGRKWHKSFRLRIWNAWGTPELTSFYVSPMLQDQEGMPKRVFSGSPFSSSIFNANKRSYDSLNYSIPIRLFKEISFVFTQTYFLPNNFSTFSLSFPLVPSWHELFLRNSFSFLLKTFHKLADQ
jgi:hypothetical protein